MSYLSRIGIAAVLLSITAASSSAQSVEAGAKIGVGVSSITNVSVITETSDDDARVNVVPTVGAFVTFGAGRRVAFQPEVLFARKGVRLDDNDTTLDLRYLEVPMLLRFTVAPEANRTVYVLVGPSVAFNLDATIRSTDAAGDDDEQDIEGLVEERDLGLTIGLGLQRRWWLVEGRFTEGLASIAIEDSDDRVRNRTFAVMFGVRFGR